MGSRAAFLYGFDEDIYGLSAIVHIQLLKQYNFTNKHNWHCFKKLEPVEAEIRAGPEFHALHLLPAR